jgi:1-acyl-sn-glycerol-3-phosphate acyltransferase
MRVGRSSRLGIGYRIAVVLLWPFLRTAIRWDIKGTEQLTDEDGGIIVAANHLSWFDPLTVSYALWMADRPPRFLAKEPLFRVPIVGPIIRNAGQIPVYRETKDAANAIRDALTALDRGECVAVYPEGTMTRDPNLWPMSAKTGAVRMALMSGRPLFPMAQWGPQEIMAPYVKEFRIWPRKTMRIRVGDPVDLEDLMGRPVNAATMREAGGRLMDAITGLLAEIRQEEPPSTRMVFRRDPS